MDNDDLPVGRILSRRETIALLAASGASLVLGWVVPIGWAGAGVGAGAVDRQMHRLEAGHNRRSIIGGARLTAERRFSCSSGHPLARSWRRQSAKLSWFRAANRKLELCYRS